MVYAYATNECISQILNATGEDGGIKWIGKDIDLWASVEPGGIQIAGTMPQDIWDDWYNSLTQKLTALLGYEIGDPGDGYDFKYWD